MQASLSLIISTISTFSVGNMTIGWLIINIAIPVINRGNKSRKSRNMVSYDALNTKLTNVSSYSETNCRGNKDCDRLGVNLRLVLDQMYVY